SSEFALIKAPRSSGSDARSMVSSRASREQTGQTNSPAARSAVVWWRAIGIVSCRDIEWGLSFSQGESKINVRITPKGVTLTSMSRKKIGLALSGGGSRGFAHVGVLKVLAEYEIPIDYISGTSIGSLVGGAFAAGMTVGEIEKMAGSVRWRHITQPS